MHPTQRHHLAAPDSKPVVLARRDGVLAVDKPVGWLTHPDGTETRPNMVSVLGGSLGVHQRLDVDTSGLLLFSTSPEGSARLTAGWADAKKRYVAVVEGKISNPKGLWSSEVGGKAAETRYAVRARGVNWTLLDLWPITGRTHQLRVHCHAAGHAIRGDMLYGESIDVRASRMLLHCASIAIGHMRFEAPIPPEFARYTGKGDLRDGLADDPGTTCYRTCNGAADGHPGWVVDRYADWGWVHASADDGPLPADLRGVYRIDAQPDRSGGQQPGPQLVSGEAAPLDLTVMEAGVVHPVLLGPQLSTGLFLDQRPQRSWLRQNAGDMRVLNLFAHAGGFSLAAACAGAQTVSVDLSRKWLERIPLGLAANGVDRTAHDQIFGDVFDWLRRLSNRGEQFDLVILDPPSTSVGKKKKRWSAARDYPELVRLAAPLVRPGGLLWAATNHRQTSPAKFVHLVGDGAPPGATLDRVCPPAVDFPTDDVAPVKTHVWRWPA